MTISQWNCQFATRPERLFTSWNFLVSPFLETYSDIAAFISQLDDLVRLREAFDFEIDGLVLKVDNLSLWKQL